jgi:hypothetical protein
VGEEPENCCGNMSLIKYYPATAVQLLVSRQMINYLRQLYPQEKLPIFGINLKCDKSSLEIQLEPVSNNAIPIKIIHYNPVSDWRQDEVVEDDVRETLIGFDIVRKSDNNELLWEINTDAATYNFTSPMPTVTTAI